ncbi:MAG: hypothetical protein GY708_23420 [Actinomycetia bacterium]|nr:hypothetical protein [Actinomycetes bacterium]MCP4958889.1 hypothetical protein [Actinomycetes bacterium]
MEGPAGRAAVCFQVLLALLSSPTILAVDPGGWWPYGPAKQGVVIAGFLAMFAMTSRHGIGPASVLARRSAARLGATIVRRSLVVAGVLLAATCVYTSAAGGR